MADARLYRLKKSQRLPTRTRCNRLLRECDTVQDPVTAETLTNTKNLLQKLVDIRVKLSELNEQILLSMDPENDEVNVDAETLASSELDDEIVDATHRLTNIIDSYQTTVLANAAPRANARDNDLRLSVKLPKLDIEKFDGDPLQWQQFWDSFESTIHNNTTLSPVDKFKYLKKYVEGDAFRVVDGYLLTAENYTTVVENLTERFGNKQLTIFSHFEAILALPAVAKHDPQQLQKTFDECERHIRSLIALGLQEDTFGQVFTPIILSKLPTYVKMELYRKNGPNAWTLQSLRDYLKKEIRVRDMSQRVFGSKLETPVSSGRSNKSSGRVSGTSASLLADSVDKKQRPIKCIFCNGKHYADQCTECPDLKSRKSKIQGRCLKCFSTKHSLPQCENKFSCFHCKLDDHHRALCPTKFSSLSVSDTATAHTHFVESEESDSVDTSLLSHGETVIMQTALTKVSGSIPSLASPGRLLFDTGSTRTFITDSLARKIKARPKGEEIVSVAGFSATKRKTDNYQIVEFDVIQADKTIKTLTANVIKTISCPIQKLPIDMKRHPMVEHLKLAEPIVTKPQSVDIDILIGSDYYYDFVGCERIRCDDGLIFVSSTLGFIATGRLDSPEGRSSVASSMLLTKLNVPTVPDIQLDRYWSLEDIGVKPPLSKNDDEEAVAEFNRTIKFKDNRYSVSWPWRSDAPDLPDNYQLACGRLKSLLKRLSTDQKLTEQYQKTIKDQEAKGIIEVAPSGPTDNRVHYIPHHGVVTPQKTTTKLRIVYDASAKISRSSPSLNDCLHRGPVILDDLCGLIMRFRLHKIGLSSDIEKAFLQVGLNNDSRDVTRFLWVLDPKLPPIGKNLVIYRFCRVPFGMNSSPFLLGGTVHHHVKTSDMAVSKDILDNLYVDNLFGGSDTAAEAKKFYTDTKLLFNQASMNLREWFTNDKEVRDFVKKADRGHSIKTKILGLEWDTETDTLSVSGVTEIHHTVNTKRLVLQNLAKTFDPCGYFSAVVIKGKILMQKIWKEGFQWDEKLPDSIIQQWAEVAEDLANIPTVKIPRYMFSQLSDTVEYQLHCFCDASKDAYSAIVYLRIHSHGVVYNKLIIAKTRVAPLKVLSIPRLELMAALIGARLCSFAETQLRLPIALRVIWSDSQCVLHWIMKDTVSTTFVKNRIREIRASNDSEYRYVPTHLNPADLSSRGCSCETLTGSKLWWSGPEFLATDRSQWPKNIDTCIELEDEKANDDSPSEAIVGVQVEQKTVAESLIDYSRFSSLSRLYRSIAWVLRFLYNVRNKEKRHGTLTAMEIVAAEEFCIRDIQMKYLPEIGTEAMSKKSSIIRNLDVYKDDVGLLRCAGRLLFADIEESAKFPILLPKNNHFTDLVIRDCHKSLFHSGIPHTLSQIRQKFWIPEGRSQVRKEWRRCHFCQRRRGGPFKVPNFPPIPEFRVSQQTPFCTVGLDYLGPLYISSKSNNTKVKIWICLFTCAVTRAVHLEVVDQLSTEQFILCLRRFVACCGKPKRIISDNAKQLHSASRFLKCDKVHEYSASNNIAWKFITEMSPWMGGFYERMVGIVKRALKNCLDSRCVSLLEMQTVLTEVKGVINSRPLVYIDSDDLGNIITPAHFLGGPFPTLPHVSTKNDEYVEPPVSKTSLLDNYKRLQNTIDNFWKQWRNQYLLGLRENKICHKQLNTNDSSPKIGSVVIIKDNTPRNQWPIAKIVALKPSRDGLCRSATVQLSNKKQLNRPLKHLYPLELQVEPKPSVTTTNDEPTNSTRRLPQRNSAKLAASKIRHVFNQESSDTEDSVSA